MNVPNLMSYLTRPAASLSGIAAFPRILRVAYLLALALPLASIAQTPPEPGAAPALATPPPAAPVLTPTVVAEPTAELSVVRINATNQPHDFFRPWGKKAPFTRRAVGAVLPGGRVLTTAELVANANYVELETPDGVQRAPAAVETVDYEANLALLRTEDAQFLKPYKPLEITEAAVGDTLSVWQIESNGALLVTKGPMTSADVSRYPVDEFPFLVYRVTASLQFRDNSFTMPVIKDGKLAGIVMRYDAQANNVEMVPAPIIQHFLKDLAQAPYEGFPRAAMSYTGTRDPQFRRYVKLREGSQGGVYVTEVLPDGPAGHAGLERGDILMRIGEYPIDQDGNYQDPTYGRISASHLLATRHYHGDVVKFAIQRSGEAKELSVTLTHRPVEQYISEPYVIDRPPQFYILGGLILQELSRQYLKEWGPDWAKKAPEELVYLDRQQTELFKNRERKKIVFLNRVLPSDATIGYEELRHLVISKINDVPLQSLSDVPGALEKASNGLHKIEFTTDPTVIYLDAEQVTSSEAILAKTYRLPTMKRLN